MNLLRGTLVLLHLFKEFVFFFTFCFIVHVDIALILNVPQMNTWWERRTSH